MQWFCHPALHQIQGLSFISLCSECSRLHGNHKVSTHAAGVCLSHPTLFTASKIFMRLILLFIHLINYKAKPNCFASNCVTLFYCLVSVYIYKKCQYVCIDSLSNNGLLTWM